MPEKPTKFELDISWQAIFKVIAVIVAAWLIMKLADIFLMFFGVFLLIAVLSPSVRLLQRRMSRFLAVLLIYSVMVLVIIVVSSVFFPTLVRQMNDLVHTLPTITGHIKDSLQHFRDVGNVSAIVDQSSQALRRALNGISGNLVDTTVGVFGGLATIFSGIVVSFYLLLEEKNVQEFLHQILPESQYRPVYHTLHKISVRMGSWVRGQAALMLLIGVSNLVGYLLIHVSSPLPLAIWAGLCEVIPFVGPFLGLIPAVIVAVTTGSLAQVVLVVVVNFIIIQQLEAHIFVPKIMSRAIGLSPVLVITALLVGAKLFGIVGTLIAVPIAAIISVVVGEWPQLRTIWETEAQGEKE